MGCNCGKGRLSWMVKWSDGSTTLFKTKDDAQSAVASDTRSGTIRRR